MEEQDFSQVYSMNNLFEKTREFVKTSFNKNDTQMVHFDRTVYWIKELKPDVDEAYLIAAVGHDIERAFRDQKTKNNFVNAKFFKANEQPVSSFF